MSRSRLFPVRTLCLIAVAAVALLSGPTPAEADDTKRYLKTLKPFGISDDPNKSKKPCICNGGPSTIDGRLGVIVASETAPGAQLTYRASCFIPTFLTADRSFNTYVSCVGSGGTFTPLSK